MWDEKDARGRTPEVGDWVAYNLSGTIAVGVVVEVKRKPTPGWWANRQSTRPVFLIEKHCPSDGPKRHISKVEGGAQCVLVLTKENE